MKKKPKKKTKILAIGDIHGDTGLVKRLADKAKKENVDLVILAGDLTLTESTKDLIGPFLKAKKQVLLVHGNHESLSTADFLAAMYGPETTNLHGYTFKKGDLGVFGAGGAIQFNTTEKEIFDVLKKGNQNIKDSKYKVMVTHMHPEGSKAEFSGWRGSSAVKKAVQKFKPNVLITAHIHEAGGIEEKIGDTKVINVARKEKVFEI